MDDFLQDRGEFDRFCEIVAEEGIWSYLEIGSKFGGALRHIAASLRPGAHVVSVDLPYGTKTWKDSEPSLKATISWLNGCGHPSRIVFGDSTDPDVVARVTELGPFDAVFIDANHTLPYLKKDWANYRPMARKLVVFHDIAWRRAPEWKGVRIDVPEFWETVKTEYRHEEIKMCHTGKNNGIGVLWV